MSTMKGVFIHEPGGPEVLKIESLPIPVPQASGEGVRDQALRNVHRRFVDSVARTASHWARRGTQSRFKLSGEQMLN
jgi:hypothetical protein